MKNTFLTVAASFGIALLSFSSCSVKEDRRPCPCYLEVRTPLHEGDCIFSVFGYSDRNLVYRQLIKDGEQVNEIALPKNVYKASSLWGAKESNVTDDLVLIPLGSECDSLYSFTSSASIDALGEQAEVELAPHKQFATLSLEFETEEVYPFEITIRGHVDGYSLYDFTPHQGEFKVKPVATDPLNSKYELRLPRQVDNSLIIEMRDRPSGGSTSTFTTKAEGEEEPFIVALGEMIARTDYDWTAEDLQDIAIKVDYLKKQITINVSDWEIVFSISMEI